MLLNAIQGRPNPQRDYSFSDSADLEEIDIKNDFNKGLLSPIKFSDLDRLETPDTG